MRKLDKKAFTLIELIVTIAVLGILVLLASPRFFGHTQNAELTKGFANARSIEKASELYYMDHKDWPRLTDDPYTSEEIESYSERIFDRTGQEVNLDTQGNYYDIDYDKLSDYIQVPDDKKNYILQNPVGKVYYMDNLNETGIARVDYSNAKDGLNPKVDLMNPIEPREPIAGEIAIDSVDKLANIGQSGYPLSGKYILTANIDLSHIDNWVPIGNNNSRFTGSFNGNGYNITGLKINRLGTDYVGLFGYTSGATIENVALEDIKVTGSSHVGGLVGRADGYTKISNSYATGEVTGKGAVGGLVGYAYSNSTIRNSYSTGEVTGSGENIGGLVGQSNNSAIESSYATGSVTGTNQVGGLVGYAFGSSNTISNSYATGPVTGTNHVGGLLGYAYNSTTIENSYSKGSVKGEKVVGGLVGNATSSTTIRNSYATGSVTGTSSVGGFVGYAQASTTITNSYATGSVEGTGSDVGGLVGLVTGSTISNSYWDKGTTKQSTSAGGGIGKSTGAMKKQTTYSGWNFNTVWEIDEGNDYPELR